VVAVASRDAVRAGEFAARYGIPASYDSYEDLLADSMIDVVYVPLPGSLHVEWTRRAAEAGKHVLCEKPIAMDAAEAETLRPLAERVHIAEGMMVRFHPQWAETVGLIESGTLGDVSHMHVAFGDHNIDGSNIRNVPGAGGGALYDIGCYAITAARWFMQSEPERVAATIDQDPDFGTDRLTSALIEFSSGRTCTFQVSTQTVNHQRVHVFGSQARLEITIPFNQPVDEPTTYLVHDGAGQDGMDAVRHQVAASDQYELQANAFCTRILNEAPSTRPLDDAIATMKVIDAVRRSSSSGRFEVV
jgi:predicted dehydrogenase